MVHDTPLIAVNHLEAHALTARLTDNLSFPYLLLLVSGGHTQLVLRRTRDVIDAIAFRRPDLVAMLHEGDRIDVVARASSRRFGGFESIQLEVLDVAAAGEQLGREGRSRVDYSSDS